MTLVEAFREMISQGYDFYTPIGWGEEQDGHRESARAKLAELLLRDSALTAATNFAVEGSDLYAILGSEARSLWYSFERSHP